MTTGGPTTVRPRMTGALIAFVGRIRAQRPTQPDLTGRPLRVTVPVIVCRAIAGVEPSVFFFIRATIPPIVFSSVTLGVYASASW